MIWPSRGGGSLVGKVVTASSGRYPARIQRPPRTAGIDQESIMAAAAGLQFFLQRDEVNASIVCPRTGWVNSQVSTPVVDCLVVKEHSLGNYGPVKESDLIVWRLL